MQALTQFLADWQNDSLNLKPVFEGYYDLLRGLPGVSMDFHPRPGITWSLRGKGAGQKDRDLFVMVDVVDDDPAARWLSVCFYADMVTDSEELGDFVPAGLNNEDAICFNLDEDNAHMRDYIAARIREAAANAA